MITKSINKTKKNFIFFFFLFGLEEKKKIFKKINKLSLLIVFVCVLKFIFQKRISILFLFLTNSWSTSLFFVGIIWCSYITIYGLFFVPYFSFFGGIIFLRKRRTRNRYDSVVSFSNRNQTIFIRFLLKAINIPSQNNTFPK